MKYNLIFCIPFLLSAASVFSQNQAREQGFITHEPFWRQALGGAVLFLPHVQAQSAVVALDGGNIRAYSTSGTPLWNYSARGRISPFITRSREGTSYLTRTNGTLIAVNRIGRELWRKNLDGPLCARIIIGWDGRLFVPTDRKIYCYTASGTLLWSRPLEAPFSIPPKLDRSGGIIFALENNNAFRMDPFGNSDIWPLVNTPKVLLSIEQRQIAVLYPDGTMELLGTAEDWYMPAQTEGLSSTLPRLPAAPIAAVSRRNDIAVTLSDGRVSLVSVDERRIIWTGDSHIREMINNRGRPSTEVEMINDERGIYILSVNGATAFTHEGRRLWFRFLENAAAIPAFGHDGVLYSGGRDWILYAYKIEDRVLPDRSALYGPIPEGTYGTGRPHAIYALNIPYNEFEARGKLVQIGNAVNSGMVGTNEPSWKSFLLTFSAAQEPIQLRIAALSLLGKIGSQETLPHLINLFQNDSEPLIRIAAINAIGDIGVDPMGIAIQSFMNFITLGGTNEQILTAIASTTGALCRFSGPPLSETGIRILTLLTSPQQPPGARRQANRELASLR